MQRQRNFPRLGAAIALVSALALLGSGLEWLIVGTVLLVWLGSLWLSTAHPPDIVLKPEASPFSVENMRAILELSESPLILTANGRVVIANGAARAVVGKHAVEQDARIAFRNPEAIELLNSRNGGSRVIRNLTRPQDCWQMRRQIIDNSLAIIELTDRTGEEALSRVHTDFVANASHELRTPLASIIGYVETLRDSGMDMPAGTTERFLSTIQREAQRLQALVSDLMSLSRIEAEKHEVPSACVALAELVRRAADDAAGAERLKLLRFDLDESVVVPGDPQQLEQVVRNLVDNALKYGGEGEPVQIILTKAGQGQARLTVADRGAGIAKEHLPHLTRRFYRTDPGRSRMSGGTGLGLAIVKHVVERHRGRLDIASTVGQGTRVTIRLPRREPWRESISEAEGDDAASARQSA